MKDYYQLLNVSRGASPEQIKHAYREYAKHFHPDRHQNSAFFTERFREIQEAYEVLSDPQRRSRYDAQTQPREQSRATNTLPRPSVAQMQEVIGLRRQVNQLQEQLEKLQHLARWQRRLHWLRDNIGLLMMLLLGGYFGFNKLTTPADVVPLPVNMQYDSAQQVLEVVQADLNAGWLEPAVQTADAYLSTAHPQLMLDNQQMAGLLHKRGRAKALLQNDSGAVRDFTLGISFDTVSLPEIYWERALILQKQGKLMAAEADYSKIIGLEPFDVDAFRSRAAVRYQLTHYARALEDYQTLQRLLPTDAEVRRWAGNCYQRMGQTENACISWKSAAWSGDSAAGDSVERYCRPAK